ncbi:hypothetical protein [Romboutsia sp.]|uniref:hypothetical protein n=1 Tax=Romboutsia sp. TaxID=1965302 RepID=UPI003F38E79B
MAKVVKSKYNSTGERCVNACLNYGELRYLNEDETPIKIEVPYDKYDEAISDFGDRVREGMTMHALDPNSILCRGNFTYAQAKNLATECKVKGLSYYEIDGSVECDHILGISASIEYALSIWNNEPRELATKKAILRAIKTYGEQFIEVFNFGESIDLTDYKKFSKRAYSTESMNDIDLYELKNYAIQEDYKQDGKKKFKEAIAVNMDVGVGLVGGFIGFILIQLSTNYGELVDNNTIYIILNIICIVVFGIVFMQGTKLLSVKHVKDDTTNISEMFNEELEKVIYENLLTEKEVYIVLKNITKGEVTKLLINMKGSVNKKISSSTIVTKETKFILDARRIVILPNEDEVKEALAKMVNSYNEKLNKEYNVNNI